MSVGPSVHSELNTQHWSKCWQIRFSWPQHWREQRAMPLLRPAAHKGRRVSIVFLSLAICQLLLWPPHWFPVVISPTSCLITPTYLLWRGNYRKTVNIEASWALIWWSMTELQDVCYFQSYRNWPSCHYRMWCKKIRCKQTWCDVKHGGDGWERGWMFVLASTVFN